MVHNLHQPFVLAPNPEKINVDEQTLKRTNKFANAVVMGQANDYQKKLVQKLKKLIGN